MRLSGFLLLTSGWIIVLAAVVLLPPSPSQAAFALAGIGVQLLGLTLVVRSHPIQRGDEG
jgi:hypothetical protein